MIKIRNLSKAYGESKALDNINLDIAPNELVCLVGPSGAGKSTLLRVIIREEKEDSGKIFIADRDITELAAKEYPYFRRKIGVVYQDYKLLPHKNVYENVAFALEVCEASNEDIVRKVPKILELVNLGKLAKNYPDELSGGEKQRVAIARALVHSPKILLADEPTGNLDPNNAWEIAQLLLKINQSGTLVIFATHNKDIVDKIRKRVVSMKKGKIISDQRVGKYLI